MVIQQRNNAGGARRCSMMAFAELQIPCIHVRTSVFGLGASHDEKAVGLGGRELCVGRIHYRSRVEFQRDDDAASLSVGWLS